MRYIKNLINNILFLLKHDILVNNMIKERRIQKNRDELINTQIDIKNINEALSNYKEGVNNIFNQYKMDVESIKYDIKQLNNYVDDKNLYLFNIIEGIKETIVKLNTINNATETIINGMSNKRVSNKGGK